MILLHGRPVFARPVLVGAAIGFSMVATLATTGAAAAASPQADAGPVKRYDVRDFFRKPERSAFRLAPDGRHLAYLARNNGRQNVFVQALDADGAPSGAPLALTNEAARDVGSYFWKAVRTSSTSRTSAATRTSTFWPYRSPAVT